MVRFIVWVWCSLIRVNLVVMKKLLSSIRLKVSSRRSRLLIMVGFVMVLLLVWWCIGWCVVWVVVCVCWYVWNYCWGCYLLGWSVF